LLIDWDFQFGCTIFVALQDPANPGECFSALQHDETLIHLDGKPAVGFGRVVLNFLQAKAQISFTAPTETIIAEIKTFLTELAKQRVL